MTYSYFSKLTYVKLSRSRSTYVKYAFYGLMLGSTLSIQCTYASLLLLLADGVETDRSSWIPCWPFRSMPCCPANKLSWAWVCNTP